MSSFLEQQKHSLQHEKCGVTAIVAEIKAGPELRPTCNKNKYCKSKSSSKKVPKQKIIRVLLDSGSDGDLLFQEKGKGKNYPYLTRQVPKSWCTSNGIFQTKGKGSLEVQFFDYSENKAVFITPDIVEYDIKSSGKPVFDLIIRTKTMNELGIILDFSEKIITIDSIKLPMTSIENLSKSNKEALDFNTSIARSVEPKSTELATQRIVKILDAKYEKANIPELIKNNCSHLNPEEQKKLLEVLTEFEDLFDGTLGDWNTEPVSFELKEGATPYHGRAY